MIDIQNGFHRVFRQLPPRKTATLLGLGLGLVLGLGRGGQIFSTVHYR